MKEFRLKNKYPGLPDDWDNGMIIGHGERGSASYYSPVNAKYTDKHVPYIQCKNYPIHWEEINQRDYEILTVTAKPNHPNLPVGSIKDSWLNINMDYFDIHSIRRIHDNEVFTVGDEIITGASDSYASIYGFKIIDNKLCINHTHSFLVNQMTPGTPSGCHLYLISKKKKPLFTTEDGIDIFEGDNLFLLGINNWVITDVSPCQYLSKHPFKGATKTEFKYFSTKQKAKEYIKLNKPYLSFAELEALNLHSSGNIILNRKELIRLINSKINE